MIINCRLGVASLISWYETCSLLLLWNVEQQ